jgi:hypothetical protein
MWKKCWKDRVSPSGFDKTDGLKVAFGRLLSLLIVITALLTVG